MKLENAGVLGKQICELQHLVTRILALVIGSGEDCKRKESYS